VSNRPFERHDEVRKEARKILLASRATESNPQEPARPEQFEEAGVKRVYTNQKQGLLAPGLSLSLEINFAPTEWRYFYDTIRIHTPKEHITIPIHGYPVMNDVLFP
jgi:hypothetical protein